ncbi:MAG: HXXEE domain-containing protein [Deltaproteobacteria bacterium]|nr:HXXEE domain-containing protein [Deltaproteobacteria bacterium]
MELRTRNVFLVLVLAQAVHSIEEYRFALYEVFAPARFASGLVSSNLAFGFAILNSAIVVFGAWCYFARVRPGRSSAAFWMWPWILVELGNGIVHSGMAILRGGYFPGLITAPVLFVLAALLASQLLRYRRSSTWAAT